jgi:hypothetical protein
MSALSQPGIHELLFAASAVILYALVQRLVNRPGSFRRSVGPGKRWEVIEGGRPKSSSQELSMGAEAPSAVMNTDPVAQRLRCGQRSMSRGAHTRND